MYPSIHNIKNILKIQVNWHEAEPKKWKIASIIEAKKKNEEKKDYPEELNKAIHNFDVLVNAFIDGTIRSVPEDIIDFNAQKLTDNQIKVLKVLMNEVPTGTVITYKDLAIKSGFGPRAGRFIGNTMHLNYWPIIIPCHRVVKTDYSLGNYSLIGPSIKEQLLIQEGITIKDHRCKPPNIS